MQSAQVAARAGALLYMPALFRSHVLSFLFIDCSHLDCSRSLPIFSPSFPKSIFSKYMYIDLVFLLNLLV